MKLVAKEIERWETGGVETRKYHQFTVEVFENEIGKWFVVFRWSCSKNCRSHGFKGSKDWKGRRVSYELMLLWREFVNYKGKLIQKQKRAISRLLEKLSDLI